MGTSAAYKGNIQIWVPPASGIAKEENGKIVRVVGNSIAYVNLPSGNSFAFSAEDIQKYAGQTLRSLGIREGVSVHVMPDNHHHSRISVFWPADNL